MESTVYKAKANRLKHVIKELEKMIDVVEREITGIIDSCDVLKRQMKIITSVDRGVHKVHRLEKVCLSRGNRPFPVHLRQ